MATRNPNPSIPQNIPAIVKHMTVAIFSGQHIGGTGTERFLNSFMVARAQLMRYGYLTGGSDEGDVANIALTGDGKKLERKKIASTGSAEKRATFDRLYLQWSEAGDKKAQKPST